MLAERTELWRDRKFTAHGKNVFRMSKNHP
jgi:hypothetical protein